MSGRSALQALPLTTDAFAPFGEVLTVPQTPGRRDYFDGGLANLRPGARPSVSLILGAPAAGTTIEVTQIERHAFSSQSFLPLAPCRWLVVVAPETQPGRPDLSRAVAFLPAPGQGLTFAAGTWHAPLTVLEKPAPFAIVMWRDGGPDDEEFAPMEPLQISV